LPLVKSIPTDGSAVEGPRYFPLHPVEGRPLPFSEAVQLHDTLSVGRQDRSRVKQGSSCLSATSQPSGSYLFSSCDGTPKSPPLWRNLMIGGARGGTPNTFFDYVQVYAVDPEASLKVLGKQE
jgi:hypothetical protein